MLAGRGKINHALHPFHVELIACIPGIQAATSLGISKVELETDANEVTKALNSSVYDDSDVGLLVIEGKALPELNFSEVVCKFRRRSCNRVAHEMAKLGLLCNEGEEVITSSVPIDVSVYIANDLLVDE